MIADLLAAPAGARAVPALRHLCIVGGGSGGHLIPGLALAERALERFPGLSVIFFRTRRPVEDGIFAGAPAGITVREMDLSPPGRTLVSWMRFLSRSWRAQRELRREIRRARPDGLIALGGYPSLPGILAARASGVPLVLLEQNRSPGRVVRRFARWAWLVACADAGAAARLGRGSPAVTTGNPLRRAVLVAAETRRKRLAREAAGPPPERRAVLVLGGSQGARAINRAVREALPLLEEYRTRISWIHVAGNADKEDMAEAYRKAGWEARVFGYTPDLPELLSQADLAISRSGGTTVAELLAVGVASVLVPYPHHRDRHQLHNALAQVEAGAATLLPEESMTPEAIRRVLREVLFDDARRMAMEKAALAAACPAAADRVLDLIERRAVEA